MRGAAFAKPVVVVGENGFCEALKPETAEAFYYHGIYGRGDGDPHNRRLAATMSQIVESSAIRSDLGRFARKFVVERFSLESVTEHQANYCREAVASVPVQREIREALRTMAIYFRERRFLIPSRDKIVTG